MDTLFASSSSSLALRHRQIEQSNIDLLSKIEMRDVMIVLLVVVGVGYLFCFNATQLLLEKQVIRSLMSEALCTFSEFYIRMNESKIQKNSLLRPI